MTPMSFCSVFVGVCVTLGPCVIFSQICVDYQEAFQLAAQKAHAAAENVVDALGVKSIIGGDVHNPGPSSGEWEDASVDTVGIGKVNVYKISNQKSYYSCREFRLLVEISWGLSITLTAILNARY